MTVFMLICLIVVCFGALLKELASRGIDKVDSMDSLNNNNEKTNNLTTKVALDETFKDYNEEEVVVQQGHKIVKRQGSGICSTCKYLNGMCLIRATTSNPSYSYQYAEDVCQTDSASLPTFRSLEEMNTFKFIKASIAGLNVYSNFVGYQRATINDPFLDSNGVPLPVGTTFDDNANDTYLCLQYISGTFFASPCNVTRSFAFCSCPTVCPNFTNPVGAVAQNLNFEANSNVTFACKPGYYMTGSPLMFCKGYAYGNATWIGTPPTCTPSVCPPLSLTHQIANATNSDLTSIIGFACPTGLALVGQSVISCIPNGSQAVWSSDPPLCSATTTTTTTFTRTTSTTTSSSSTTPMAFTSTTSAELTSTTIPVALTVTKISMTLSCSFLVIAIGIIMFVTILIRDFSIETCLHLNQEIALFFAHLLLLIFRDRVDLMDVCVAASASIQYFFTTSFFCMVIEAFHSHAILQNVVSFGGVFDRPRLKYSIVGWFVPIIPTGVTVAMRYDKYPSTYGCYVNLGDQIAIFIMGPIIVSFILTIILTEAAAMGDWKPLPLSSKFQRLAAHVNQKMMTPLALLSFGSWYLGLWASYLNSPYVFSFGSGINMAFGVSVVVFHFIENPKLNNWLHQKVVKHFCSKQQNP